MEPKTSQTTSNGPQDQRFDVKRAGKIDMHTLYEQQMRTLKSLTNDELQTMIDGKGATKYSEEQKSQARQILHMRLDPEDNDTITM